MDRVKSSNGMKKLALLGLFGLSSTCFAGFQTNNLIVTSSVSFTGMSAGVLQVESAGSVITSKVSLSTAIAGNLDLSSHVEGNLPVTNLNSGNNASYKTYWRGDGKWVEPIFGGFGVEYTNCSAEVPTSGCLTIDSNVPTSASVLHVDPVDAHSADISDILDRIVVNQTMIKVFQNSMSADPDPTSGVQPQAYGFYLITSAAIDIHGDYELYVSTLAGTGTFTPDEKVGFVLSGLQTSGSSGSSVYSATATASFPFGMSASTYTMTGSTHGVVTSNAGDFQIVSSTAANQSPRYLMGSGLVIATDSVKTDYSFHQAGSSRFGERWYWNTTNNALASPLLQANTFYCSPWYKTREGVIDAVAIGVVTGGAAGSSVRVGFYKSASDTDLYPTQLVADFGKLDASRVAVSSMAVSMTVVPNQLYFQCLITDSTPTIRGTTTAFIPNIYGSSNSTGAGAAIINTLLEAPYTYGVFPSSVPAGGTLLNNVNVPLFPVRYSQ